MELDFARDEFGNEVLSGRTFENSSFSAIEILPKIGQQTRVENCKFVNCSTSPGTCVIGSGVTLKRVEIQNLDCGDAIRIDSNATLWEVVIKGSKPNALIVQPESELRLASMLHSHCEFQLDISEFYGEVTIVGLGRDMVKKDPNRHVTVECKWKDEIDWKGLGIGPFSYWRIFLKKLAVFGAEIGVFSLPHHNDKHWTESLRERTLIEKAGAKTE